MRTELTAAEVISLTKRLDHLELWIAVASDIDELVAHRSAVIDLIDESYRMSRLNGGHLALRRRARAVRADAEFAIGGMLNYLLDTRQRHSGGPRNPKLKTLSDYKLSRSLPDRWTMAARRAAALQGYTGFNEALARASDEDSIKRLIDEQTAVINAAIAEHRRRAVTIAIARRMMAKRKGGMLMLAHKIAVAPGARQTWRSVALQTIEEFWESVTKQEMQLMPISGIDTPVTRISNFEKTDKGTWHRQVYSAIEESAPVRKSS